MIPWCNNLTRVTSHAILLFLGCESIWCAVRPRCWVYAIHVQHGENNRWAPCEPWQFLQHFWLPYDDLLPRGKSWHDSGMLILAFVIIRYQDYIMHYMKAGIYHSFHDAKITLYITWHQDSNIWQLAHIIYDGDDQTCRTSNTLYFSKTIDSVTILVKYSQAG